MGKFVKGNIVVVPFPFSDLSSSKRRPALVLVDLKSNDFILCQITSKTVLDDFAVTLNVADIEDGTLNATSNIRPNKLFTADKGIVLYKVGTLRNDRLSEVINKITDMFQS